MRRLLTILFLFVAVVGIAQAQTATTLSAAMSDSQTYLTVSSATGITAPNGSVIQTIVLVDGEFMNVNAVSGKRITVTRGVRGTKAQVHASGAVLLSGDPSSTFNMVSFSQTVRCITQFDAVTGTTGTTLTNVSGLVVSLVPGTYHFYVHLPGVTTANAGVKYAFKYSTVPTSIESISRAYTASAVAVTHNTTTTDQTLLTDSAGSGGGPVVIDTVIEGTMVVATSGTVQLQAAQKSAHADTTSVYAGAYMTFVKLY